MPEPTTPVGNTPCPRCDGTILWELCCKKGCQRPMHAPTPSDVIKELVKRHGCVHAVNLAKCVTCRRALKLADLLDTLVSPSGRLEWRPRPSEFIVALQELCRE